MKRKWIKETSKSDNLIAVLKNFVYYNKLQVTNSSIESDLSLHSSFPGFQCISDVLHNWLVPNKILKISSEKLYRLPLPAIVYLEEIDKYVLLMSIENDEITYIDTKSGWRTESLKIFLKKWDGVVLIARKQTNSGEEGYVKKRKKKILETTFKVFILAVIFTFLIGGTFRNLKDYPTILNYLIVFVAKIIGFSSSMVLLKLEFGLNNSILNKICYSSKKLSCYEVLHSKRAKFFGKYSLAEIGFVYFLSTLIYFILSPENLNVILVLFIISSGGVLYSFYLIYYQFFYLKKACPFCLITELSIFIEFASLFLVINEVSNFQLTIKQIVLGFGILFLSIYIVNEFKLVLLLKRENMILKKERNLFSQNHSVIKTFLETQPKIVSTIKENEFILNEKYSENNLIFVISLNCRFCGDIIREVQKILYSGIKTNICIRFIYSSEKEKEVIDTILSHIVKGDKETALDSLFTWFNNKKGKDYSSKWYCDYKTTLIDEAIKISEYNQHWANENKIYGTPSIVINNTLVPQKLNADIFHYLKDI
jgi:uncharacterized membrane protein